MSTCHACGSTEVSVFGGFAPSREGLHRARHLECHSCGHGDTFKGGTIPPEARPAAPRHYSELLEPETYEPGEGKYFKARQVKGRYSDEPVKNVWATSLVDAINEFGRMARESAARVAS